MSYMFEDPEYQKIKLPKKLSRRFPAYELYLYGEGSYARRNKKLQLAGVPVLFLPGNAGSYKQVRSLGSVALRKAEDIDFKYHFNFFSVNFNEELVALYGGSLRSQTRFVHECIKVILRLYKGQDFAPRSVAIVGHSMGGLVARALLTLDHFEPELLNLLITQAAPHAAPVVPLDRYLTDFYVAVNSHWARRGRDVQNLTALSVAGGFRDYQVRSGLTFLPTSARHGGALSVVSSAVPRTWASTDHLSIVWCKQLILATVRAFFDLVDADTRQITADPRKRLSVLNHHFVRHPAKPFQDEPDVVAELPGEAAWIRVKVPRWTYTVLNESDEKYFLFPLAGHRGSSSHVYCQNSLLDTRSWIFGCRNGGSSCLEGIDLSWKAELLPTVKAVRLKLRDYPALSHLVLHVPALDGKKFTVDCEFFREDQRTSQLPVTHLFSLGLSWRTIVPNSTGLLHRVELLDFGQIYQAFRINVVSSCPPAPERRPNIYRLHIPWSHEDSLTLSKAPSSTDLSAKLHVARPENGSGPAVLEMYTSADCRYRVTIKTSFPQVLGQVIRFHGESLPAYIIASILLGYGGQLSSLLSTGRCGHLGAALQRTARPYKVEPVVHGLNFLLGFGWFREAWEATLLPEPDVIPASAGGLRVPLVSPVLFLFGTALAYWGHALGAASLRLLASARPALPGRIPVTVGGGLGRAVTRVSFRWSARPRGPGPAGAACGVLVLVPVGWTACGAVALVLAGLLYALRVIHLHSVTRTPRSGLNVTPGGAAGGGEAAGLVREATENGGSGPEPPAEAEAEDSLRMHVTALHFLAWIVLLSAPSLIYWFRNLRYSIQLDPDPCKPLALILVPTVGILMNSSAASVRSSKFLKMAARVPPVLSVATVAFGAAHLYRVPYLASVPLVLHALCSVV
ncbi:GPI inositol-deacylase [Ornithorhynchus anatinus]|uniref:GPI inositol-deacylase n=1 Tax=Ornithorhynchus anatinus TaxID=9258 RepID=UPI0010A8C00C|nr:GPI inositol-deacylase [Ornithorhynchus anatinus]